MKNKMKKELITGLERQHRSEVARHINNTLCCRPLVALGVAKHSLCVPTGVYLKLQSALLRRKNYFFLVSIPQIFAVSEQTCPLRIPWALKSHDLLKTRLHTRCTYKVSYTSNIRISTKQPENKTTLWQISASQTSTYNGTKKLL